MGVIDRAILQDEIRQAIAALFATGQVGRIEPVKVLYKKVSPDEVIDNVSAWGNEVVPGIEENFTEGEKYAVRFDHGTYEVECKRVNVDEENGGGWFYYLGNPSVLAKLGISTAAPDIDTGESFVVLVASFGMVIAADMDKSQSIVVTSKETIHPIDPKYLPGVCLPVVELETTVVSEAAFTDAENAMLTQAFDSGLPPVINANFSDGVSIYQNVATVAQTATVDSNRAYLVQQGSFVYQIISADGVTWVVL